MKNLKEFSTLTKEENKAEPQEKIIVNGKEEAYAELLQTAREERAAGRLSDGEIDAFCAKVSGFLTGEQREILQRIAEELKKS